MDCSMCREIVDGDIKRCKACIEVRALSISDVDSEYKGWLACEIIASRSHGGTHVRDNADSSGSADDGGAPGSPVAEQSNAVGASC